ncbi:MAG: MBL fold metallo-hydrolase [Phascolarctobacterium faecium]
MIDPYYDEKTAVLLEGKIVDLLLVTHEHYDHISGVNKFKELYGCKLLSNSKCDNNLQRPAKNFSKYFEAYYEFQADLQKPDFAFDSNYSCSADELLMTALPLDGSIILCLSRWFPGTAKAVISFS